jgi:hypothetical protein
MCDKSGVKNEHTTSSMIRRWFTNVGKCGFHLFQFHKKNKVSHSVSSVENNPSPVRIETKEVTIVKMDELRDKYIYKIKNFETLDKESIHIILMMPDQNKNDIIFAYVKSMDSLTKILL